MRFKETLKQDYRDLIDVLSEILCTEVLDLNQLSNFTTLCKAFGRLSKLVLICLLDESVPNKSEIFRIDATGLTRSKISKHYAKRCKIHIRSMKTTPIIHSDKQIIVGVHATTTRKHDIKIILSVVATVPTR